jgi:membrane protein required for colicin V production
MTIDLIGGVVLLLFFIRGCIKGFVSAVFSLLAVLVGIVCALKLSHAVAGFLTDLGLIRASWAVLLSYLALFLLSLWGVRLVADLIEKALQTLPLGGVLNRLGGGLIYLAAGLILWSGALALADKAHLISAGAAADSRSYAYIRPIAPWAFDGFTAIWPLLKEAFSHVGDFFGNLNKKLGDYVGSD